MPLTLGRLGEIEPADRPRLCTFLRTWPGVDAELCEHDQVSARREDLVAGWWEYHRLADGARDEREALEVGEPAEVVAAKERVDSLVAVGGPTVLSLLEALIDADPTGGRGALVGAGPLENLIHEHGDALAQDLVIRARQSPAFAHALSYVWLETGGLHADAGAQLSPWLKPDENSRSVG